MSNKPEIESMLDRLLSKRKFRLIKRDKLASIFANAYHHTPYMGTDNDLQVIKQAGKRQIMDQVRSRHPRIQARRLIPATSAILVVMLAFSFWAIRYLHNGEKGRLVSVKGDVVVIRESGTVKLVPGDSIAGGDVIEVGMDSFAEIRYREDVHLKILEGSRLTISALAGRNNSRLVCRLDLSSGGILLYFKKLSSADEAVLTTPTTVARVRGTKFRVVLDKDRSVHYEVLEGKVRVSKRVVIETSPADVSLNNKVNAIIGEVLDSEGVLLTENEACHVTYQDHIALKMKLEKSMGTLSGLSLSRDAVKRAVMGIKEARPRMYSLAGDNARLVSEFRKLLKISGDTEVKVQLSNLIVKGIPDDARIYINGVFKGTGGSVIRTGRGDHILTVQARGYRDYNIRINLQATTQTVVVRMQRKKQPDFRYGEWFKTVYSSHIVSGDNPRIFLAIGRNGHISAISHGRLLWDLSLNTPIVSCPVWDAQRLYLSTGNEYIIAVSLARGTVLWRWKTNGALHPCTRIVIAGNQIYAGTQRGYLYKFSKTGSLLWELPMPGAIYSTPIIKGNLLFTPVQDGKIYCVDVELKHIVRYFDIGRISGTSFLVIGEMIYAVNDSKQLVSYNFRQNRFAWRYTIGSGLLTDIIFKGGSLYVAASSGDIYKIDRDGILDWKINVGGTVEKNPVIRGNKMYVLAKRAFYVINLTRGIVDWSFVIPSEASSNIALKGDSAYFGTTRNGIIRVNR